MDNLSKMKLHLSEEGKKDYMNYQQNLIMI